VRNTSQTTPSDQNGTVLVELGRVLFSARVLIGVHLSSEYLNVAQLHKNRGDRERTFCVVQPSTTRLNRVTLSTNNRPMSANLQKPRRCCSRLDQSMSMVPIGKRTRQLTEQSSTPSEQLDLSRNSELQSRQVSMTKHVAAHTLDRSTRSVWSTFEHVYWLNTSTGGGGGKRLTNAERINSIDRTISW
jgi:hypothetical protein